MTIEEILGVMSTLEAASLAIGRPVEPGAGVAAAQRAALASAAPRPAEVAGRA